MKAYKAGHIDPEKVKEQEVKFKRRMTEAKDKEKTAKKLRNEEKRAQKEAKTKKSAKKEQEELGFDQVKSDEDDGENLPSLKKEKPKDFDDDVDDDVEERS